jgi:serralysin
LADTFNIGTSGAVVHAITGGTGTDTTSLSVKQGWVDPSSIATENLNITVNAGDDVTIAAGKAFNAATTAITVAGGNSLSTFSTLANANTVLADAVKTFDASGFAGNITVSVANDKLDDTVTITGGAMTTDSVTATLATAGTYKTKTVGIESLLITVAENGTKAFTLDLSSSTGVKTVVANVGAADTMTVDKVTDQLTQVVAAASDSVIEVKLVDATGATDSVSFELKDAATNLAAGAKLKTTDVETINIKVSSAESISLADVSIAAADKFASLVLTGDKALTISALNADVNVINASGMATGGSVVQTGRSGTTAATYTGSAGADTFIIGNLADVISAGEGSDTLDINVTAVLGGIVVDLSATDAVVQANGSLNTTVQSGFINVDLAGYAGGYGAVVTANKAGSTIVGTATRDEITGGAGNDTIMGTEAAIVAAADVITFGAGTDTLEITDNASVDFSSMSFTGAEGIILAADTAADAVVVGNGQFNTGAVSITLRSAIDTDNDTITFKNGGTVFEAAAEADAASVDIAGEWFADTNVGDDAVLVYFNEALGGVTTVTIVGLDDGAFAISSDNIVFTA